MDRIGIYMTKHGCDSVPYGTKIADVIDGVQYNSIAINPSFDRFEVANEFMRRQPDDIFTGRELVGMVKR